MALSRKKMKEMDAKIGNKEIIHIDSFGSNTRQGGYETLCAEQAVLNKFPRKFFDLEEQYCYFCSDAGSGYKSAETILGLRS